jgi:hypothetical protein
MSGDNHPGSPYSWAVKRVLIDQTIYTDYGQLDLVWSEAGGFDGDFDRFFAGQVNGLVELDDDRLLHAHALGIAHQKVGVDGGRWAVEVHHHGTARDD